MAEAIEINKSLTTLKDCIRARALWSIAQGEAAQKNIRIPFRGTKLTQVLKSAFDVNGSQTCKTVIIACVSPSILNVAQSKNTLRYAEMLKIPIPKAKPRAFDARIPTTWTNKDVYGWIKKNVYCHLTSQLSLVLIYCSQERRKLTLSCSPPKKTVPNSAD